MTAKRHTLGRPWCPSEFLTTLKHACDLAEQARFWPSPCEASEARDLMRRLNAIYARDFLGQQK